MPDPPKDTDLLASIANIAPPALQDLGDAVGELVDEMLRVDDRGPEFEADLARALEHVRAAIERVRPHGRSLTELRMPFGPDPGEHARPYYVGGPVVGQHNPTFPMFDFQFESAERSSGTVRFPLRFEGPPASLHGGLVALFFDQILGHHNLAAGLPAMTGTLTVRYHRPTPLFRDLQWEVVSRKAGERKIINAGRIWEGETTFAEAEGLFILPRRPMWQEEGTEAKAESPPDA